MLGVSDEPLSVKWCSYCELRLHKTRKSIIDTMPMPLVGGQLNDNWPSSQPIGWACIIELAGDALQQTNWVAMAMAMRMENSIQTQMEIEWKFYATFRLGVVEKPLKRKIVMQITASFVRIHKWLTFQSKRLHVISHSHRNSSKIDMYLSPQQYLR